MDLQFLTAEQLQLTLRLCDVLSMEDMTVAAAVLANYDWNLENAINDIPLGSYKQYNEQPTLIGTYSTEEQQFLQEENNYNYEKHQNVEQRRKIFEEEHISLVPLSKTLSEPRNEFNILEFHRMLAKDSKIHRGEYLKNIMSNSQALCKKILQSNPENKRKYIANKWKIQNNTKFINNLYTNYQPRWNFTFGTFFLNLTRSYLQGKHLLVYIHSINPENERKYKKVLDLVFRQKEISNFVNENCIVYGIFDNSDEYDILQKYAPLKDLPAFAVFTMNKEKRQEKFVSSYKLSTKNEVFLEWLAESIGIKLNRRGSEGTKTEVKEKVQEKKEKKEDYNAHSYLMEQQDELYHELEKTYNQKRQLSLQRREKIHTDEENLKKRIEEFSKEIQPVSGEDTIQIRFRMANTGQTKSRRFYMGETAQKLFTFVDCTCRDHFQQKFNSFDLIQTHPPLVLSNFREKPLSQIFEGSNRENIIVRQI